MLCGLFNPRVPESPNRFGLKREAQSCRIHDMNWSGARALILFILTVTLTSISSCTPREAPQRYELKGKVVSVDLKGSTVTIAHEAIAGYMDAMVMPFSIKDKRMLNDLAEGDGIQATLVVAGPRSWLEDVIATRTSALDPASVGGSSADPQAGAAVPDFSLTDQDGKRVKLSQYRGKALLVTFVYTRCPLPDYCPLMTGNFAEIDKGVKSDAVHFPPTHLLTISIDPEYDSPKVLRDYRAGVGANFGNWQFAGGSKEEIKSIATFFGMSYWTESDQIIHSLRTALIDENGRLVKLYSGNSWKPVEVLSELRGLRKYPGVGVVQAIDRETGTLQIDHKDIDGLMTSMDMPFRVKDKSMLDVAGVGDQVEFTLQSEDTGLVVTSIKRK